MFVLRYSTLVVFLKYSVCSADLVVDQSVFIFTQKSKIESFLKFKVKEFTVSC